MTRFVLHIGPHKTGTTYIQETLFALGAPLLERGVYLPTLWNAAPGVPSHMQLVWALRSGDLAPIERQLGEMLARQPRTVAISCEALSRLAPEQIARLRDMLGTAPVRVVYYVRRWPERLPSLWQEEVKFGDRRSLPEYLTEQLTKGDGSEIYDIAAIDRFAAVFGREAIAVVSYNHLVEQGVDIAGHFLASFLDAAGLASPAAGRPNRSLPALETEMVRALNILHARHGGDRSPAVRDWYLAKGRDSVPDGVLDAMRDNVATIRLDETAVPFPAVYHELLDRYAASRVAPYWSHGLHVPRAVDAAFVRDDYLLDLSVAGALRDFYDLFRLAQ